MEFAGVLVFALAVMLDLAFGDPRGMPHIVKLMGNSCAFLERWVTRLCRRTVLAGVLLWLGVAFFTLAPYFLLSALLNALHPWAAHAFDIHSVSE